MSAHRCPPNCHRCPDLDDDVMPGCMGTAAMGGTKPRSLAWCTCSVDVTRRTEDSLAARIAVLEQRVAELEEAR